MEIKMEKEQRLISAYRLKATYKANIEFLKGRLEIQKSSGYDRFASMTGLFYTDFDLEEMENKLARVREVIKELR